MNQWLTESEKLIKNEEKIGSDIDVLQEQIKDTQVGFSLYAMPWELQPFRTQEIDSIPSCAARMSHYGTSDSWDITWYTIQKRCVNSIYHCSRP